MTYSEVVEAHVNRIRMYPLILLICSIPVIILRLVVVIKGFAYLEKDSGFWIDLYLPISVAFVSSDGILNSIVFGTSPPVLKCWREFLSRYRADSDVLSWNCIKRNNVSVIPSIQAHSDPVNNVDKVGNLFEAGKLTRIQPM